MDILSDNLLVEKIGEIVDEALKNHVFTACSLGYFFKKEKEIKGNLLHYGFAGQEPEKISVDKNTVFDLASLTKPLVVSLCLLSLLEEGKLHIEDSLHKFFKTSIPGADQIQIFHLLTHSSGLPAHRPYFEKLIDIPKTQKKSILIEWIMAENLVFKPGTDNLYSDLGFILLGLIIEKISGESLDEYWRRNIIFPIGLEKSLFFANKGKKGNVVYAETGKCGWSKIRLYGTVNDDNCRALGGVAGHAGLFGTAEGVLALCENIYLQFRGDIHHPSYSNKLLKKAFSNKHGSWLFGFDTPAVSGSSAGKFFSNLSVGHLGFTGTSFWIDLQRGRSVVLLTNRVSCGESLQPIKRLRPHLHDSIMEIL